MAPFPRLKTLSKFALTAAFFAVAGCHSNQQQSANNSNQSTQQEEQPSSDPASANLAPVASGGTGSESATATSQESSNPQGSTAANSPSNQEYSAPQENLPPSEDSPDESDYGIAPEATAPQPPPALPQYDQPPCPGDGYIWTPGYWDYAPAGYYWVPGAWVEAPYEGALWTPGYWAYDHSRYAYYHGYWARHIGFYGGINYGFGYVGIGYQGGYWNNGHFAYNRYVNNVNVTVVHNVYNYQIRYNTVSRVSFNGGRGGIQVRPRLAELAALREPHVAPMRPQIDLRSSAMSNRAQFESANHGRPAEVAFTRPVAAEHNVRPETPQVRNLPPMRMLPEPRATAPATRMEANHPEANRAAPVRPENRAAPNRVVPTRPEPSRTQSRPVQPQRAEPNRPEQPRAETHAAPARPERTPARAPAARPQTEKRKPTPEHREEANPHM